VLAGFAYAELALQFGGQVVGGYFGGHGFAPAWWLGLL
jgi:hypothetical protein